MTSTGPPAAVVALGIPAGTEFGAIAAARGASRASLPEIRSPDFPAQRARGEYRSALASR